MGCVRSSGELSKGKSWRETSDRENLVWRIGDEPKPAVVERERGNRGGFIAEGCRVGVVEVRR